MQTQRRKYRILVVGEATRQREAMGEMLTREGFDVVFTESSGETVRTVETDAPAVALIDTFLSGSPPQILTHAIRKASPRTECIVLLGHPSHRQTALNAIKEGAFAYVLRSPDNQQLLMMIQRAIEHGQLIVDMDEMRRRLAVLFNALPAGILIVDAETRLVVDANHAALEIIGEPRENVTGKLYYSKRPQGLADATPPDSAPAETPEELRLPATTSVAEIELGGRRHLIESFVDMTGRLQAEAAAARYERLVRYLIENVDDAILEVDPAGIIQSVISPGRTSLGRLEPEHPLMPALPKACHDRFERALLTAVEQGERSDLAQGGGTTPEWMIHILPVREAENTSIIVVVRELSAKQRTEARLLLRGEAFNHIEDAVIIVNDRGLIVDANPTVCTWLEMSAAELTGTSYYDLDRFVPHTKWTDQLKALEEEVQVEYESQLYNRDGVRHRVHVAMQAAHLIDEPYVICVYERLNKVVQLDETIHTLENTENVLLGTIEDPVFLLDREGTILKLNDAAAETLPQGHMKAVGSSYYEHLGADIATARRRRIEDVFLIGHAARFEDHDGERHYTHNARPVHDHAGTLRHVVLMTRDITDEREARRRLKEVESRGPAALWILDATRTHRLIAEADPALRDDTQTHLSLHHRVMEDILASLTVIDSSPTLVELASAADSEKLQLKPGNLFKGNARLTFAAAVIAALETGQTTDQELTLSSLHGEDSFVRARLTYSDMDDGRRLLNVWLTDMTALRDTRADILRVTARERRRIGRELLEELNPVVEALTQNDTAASTTGDLTEKLRTRIERMAGGLDRESTLEGSLIAALQRLAKETKDLRGIDCRCNLSSPKAVDDNVIASHLFGVAREAVDFAIRNHNASSVIISLSTGKTSSRLSIRDDGVSPENPHDDPAWYLITHHAEMIDARIEADHGTKGNTLICIFH